MIVKKVVKTFNEFKKQNVKKNKKIKMYLAGSIEFAKNNGTTWRNRLEKILSNSGYDVFNPANEAKLFKELRDMKRITKGNTFNVKKMHDQFTGVIFEDLEQVLTSDLIICKWDNNIFSCGTSGELTIAKLFNIPVIMIVDNIFEVPKWIVGCVSMYEPDFRRIKTLIKRVVENTEC